MNVSRRSFLIQQQTNVPSNMGPMDENSYRPVTLPPKGSAPLLNEDQRNDLEHQLRCQCGCNLDVYTCRTTDFSCPVSPAMHRDMIALVAGGYATTEIVAAYRRVYGERVLMSPAREGFNWVGYFLPSVAIAAGAVVLVRYIRSRSHKVAVADAAPHVPSATQDELERLRAAIRDDS
ncbi:MAG: cytochrome c-type biogenesis protein CcmH [Gemmatimonadaceae bacterium]|nr:cytochrome c-type biogenesis protein CcmH [Gemmatimonadaceae bacterium]